MRSTCSYIIGVEDHDQVKRLIANGNLFGRIIRSKDAKGFNLMSDPWKVREHT